MMTVMLLQPKLATPPSTLHPLDFTSILLLRGAFGEISPESVHIGVWFLVLHVLGRINAHIGVLCTCQVS